jgi:hypothetical protein
VASFSKKSALKRLVLLNQPDVLLLQDFMGDEVSVANALKTLFPSWNFVHNDVNSHSGGVVMGWNIRSINLRNSWVVTSGIGVDFFYAGLGM